MILRIRSRDRLPSHEQWYQLSDQLSDVNQDELRSARAALSET